jgi:hypothetical protein
MADISISGSAKVNNYEGDTTMEADLVVNGKSGDTSVTANLSLDTDGTSAIDVEQLYATTSIAGVSVKAGNYKGGKSELGTATGHKSSRYNLGTSFGGVKLAYEDNNNGSNSSTISGTVGGVAISHKSVKGGASETKASGTVGGVSVKMHQKADSNDVTNTSVTLTTSVQGVNLTYVDVKADQAAGTEMDGFFGKKVDATATGGSDSRVATAAGFGISTDIAGNKVTYKTMDILGSAAGSVETTTKKVIVTRKLTSGATFEATYVNAASNTLDLELAVKF